jgi:hypothetical protein
MQPDAILAAGDLRGIGATLDDAGDDGGVARHVRLRGDDDAVTDAKSGVGGEAAVYCDGAWRVLRRDGAERDGEEEKKESEWEFHGAAG